MIDEEILIPLALFGGIFGVIGMRIVVKGGAKVLCHWRDVSLKMRMVEAGFRADEIEQVMSAGRGPVTQPQPGKPPKRVPGYEKELA